MKRRKQEGKDKKKNMRNRNKVQTIQVEDIRHFGLETHLCSSG